MPELRLVVLATQEKLAYGQTFGEAMNGLFGEAAQTAPPSSSGDWDAAIRESAVSVHDALTRHPWACPLLMEPGRIRPARLRYMDLLLGRLREAGFSSETTYTAYHVLDGHIFGFALWEAGYNLKSDDAEELAASVMPMLVDYPYLREHAEQHMSEGSHHEASPFELGLDLILEGLREMRDAGES